MIVKNVIRGAMVLLLLAVATPIFAQQQMPRRTPEERAQHQLAWMQKNLSLSGDQGKKAYDVLLHYANEADKVMSTPAGPERRELRMSMQKSKDENMKGILTADQFQKYQAHEQEMKDRMMQRKGMQGGGEGS